MQTAQSAWKLTRQLPAPLAAVSGQRGLPAGGTGLGRLVCAGNMTGAWSPVIAALVFSDAAK